MKSKTDSDWFVLTIDRADKKHLVLDNYELSLIPPEELSIIASKMTAEGMHPVVSEEGEWLTIAVLNDFTPYLVPPSIRELARYIPCGTVITFDDGCNPSIEWRFGELGIEVFDTFDY